MRWLENVQNLEAMMLPLTLINDGSKRGIQTGWLIVILFLFLFLFLTRTVRTGRIKTLMVLSTNLDSSTDKTT